MSLVSLGAEYVEDEVIGFDCGGGRLGAVLLAREGRISTAVVVNAAGAFSRAVGRLAGVEVPVDPVRQQLVRCALPRPWSYQFPMVMDPSGTHWRHEDPDRIVIAKTRFEETPGVRFDPDPDRFERDLLPDLSRRVPEFRDLRFLEAWAGLYEMTADHNAVLGEHPDRRGLFLATGFSGHGLMLAPATGKVTSEMIRLGRSETVDVSLLSVDRFRTGKLFFDEAMI